MKIHEKNEGGGDVPQLYDIDTNEHVGYWCQKNGTYVIFSPYEKLMNVLKSECESTRSTRKCEVDDDAGDTDDTDDTDEHDDTDEDDDTDEHDDTDEEVDSADSSDSSDRADSVDEKLKRENEDNMRIFVRFFILMFVYMMLQKYFQTIYFDLIFIVAFTLVYNKMVRVICLKL
jgi:hypothetical protein